MRPLSLFHRRTPGTRRRSLARRLFVVLIAMLFALVVAAGARLVTFRASVGGLEGFRSDTVVEANRVGAMRTLLESADDAGEAYVESGDPADPAKGAVFEGIAAEIDRGFAEMTVDGSPSERRVAIVATERWGLAYDSLQEALLLPERSDGARLDAFHDLVDESGAELGNAFALAIDEVSDEITTLRSRERVQLTVSFAILLLGFVVGGLLSRRVYRSITSPLKTLEEAATRLGQDDLSHRIDVHGDDELARVGSAFNSMAERLQQSRDELSHLALHDQLTGLPNRALFIEQLGHAVARSRRRGSPVSVLFLDLDGFKAVNDTFGHEAGDEVLVGVADRLRRTLRDEDMIARLGGDEFGIILEEELQGATLTAERIIRRFEKPWSSSSGISPVGVSIGISSRAGDEEVDELLRQSDIAMYAAKAAGKGRWRILSPELGGE